MKDTSGTAIRGVGILSMHSTYDVASKADLWALYEGFVAFFKS